MFPVLDVRFSYGEIDLWLNSPTVYFLALSQARQVFSPLQNKQLSSFLSGSIARTSVGFIVMPFTVLKSRAESSLRPTATLAAHAKEIYKTAGIRGFWLGTVPSKFCFVSVLVKFDLCFQRA